MRTQKFYHHFVNMYRHIHTHKHTFSIHYYESVIHAIHKMKTMLTTFNNNLVKQLRQQNEWLSLREFKNKTLASKKKLKYCI